MIVLIVTLLSFIILEILKMISNMKETNITVSLRIPNISNNDSILLIYSQ